MPAGPGKYDLECSEMLLRTGAKAALLIVFGGYRGSGFSMSLQINHSLLALDVPRILRETADEIERSHPKA